MIHATLPIAGKWQIRLDPNDVGISQNWAGQSFEQSIQLPGALQNQGFGEDIVAETKWTGELATDKWLNAPQFAPYRKPGNIKFPFFLTPEKHYVGPAWYAREIEIPADFSGRRIVLRFERAHWQTQLWIDGIALGSRDSLSTPHEYELPSEIQPGKHRLTLRVDNRVQVEVGLWAHSITDHTQGNWNGVVGEMSIYATSKVWIDNVQSWPDVTSRTVHFAITIGSSTAKPGKGSLLIDGVRHDIVWNSHADQISIEHPLGKSAALWDEFHPVLHSINMHLTGENADDRKTVQVGLRKVESRDKKLWINGRELFLRGTLECCIFPLTGFPPTDLAQWKRIMRIVQSHGLNHIRFHSWCPPENAFVAADEAGVYLQIEVCAWATVGDGKPVDQWLYDEAARIVREYGSHPSFILMAHGNEPHGKVETRDAWLVKWVEYWQKTDPRRLHIGGSGWPMLPTQDVHIEMNGVRGPVGWLGQDYSAKASTYNKPVLVHEMCQWAVFPDLDERKKYTGPLKPKSFDIYEDSLRENGLLDQWKDFHLASGAFQLLCYKEDIEAALRTPGISGIQLLDIRDFPGQGMAPIGMNDPFWDPKRYHQPENFRRFCDQTVLLLRLIRRTFSANDKISAVLDITHFGESEIKSAVIDWRLIDDAGKVAMSGSLDPVTIPLGRSSGIANIEIGCSSLKSPASFKLELQIRGTKITNDWRVWVYPTSNSQVRTGRSPEIQQKVHVTSNSNDVNEHDRVLLFVQPDPTCARLTFEPIFWTNILFPTSPRKTLGVIVDPQHPALAEFPTRPHSDWQWAEIVRESRAMILAGVPKGTRPLVQMIDDWNLNRLLALAFECRIGHAKVIVCSSDLPERAKTSLAAAQLLQSFLAYMQSEKFDPKLQLDIPSLEKIVSPGEKSQANAGAIIDSCSSFDAGNPPENVLYADLNLFWHSQYSPNVDPLPHQLTIDLRSAKSIAAVRYVPRQDRTEGRIARYEIYCFNDTSNPGSPTAVGTWEDGPEEKIVRLPTPVRARFIRLVALEEVKGRPYASAAVVEAIVQ